MRADLPRLLYDKELDMFQVQDDAAFEAGRQAAAASSAAAAAPADLLAEVARLLARAKVHTASE